MILFLAGPIFGHLKDFYYRIENVENIIGKEADYVLQIGNFGCYPDPIRLDRAMRIKGGGIDFSEWYIKNKPVPRKTIFIPGKHEDHRWMEEMLSRKKTEFLPNLVWLVNGYSTTIGFGGEECTILSLGKLYSPMTFNEGRGKYKKRLAHYTRSEVEKACSAGPVDIFLSYEDLGQPGIKNIHFATRPKISAFRKKLPIRYPYDENRTFPLGTNELIAINWTKEKYDFLYK